MFEMLMTPKIASAPPAQLPLLGYNFSNQASTSSPATTSYSNGGSIVAIPSPLEGYTKSFRSQTNEILLSPGTAVNNIGTTDFTFEYWVYMVSPATTYQTLFSIQYANGYSIHAEFGDSGYSNRLYVTMDASKQSTIFVCPFTSTSASNKNRWVHIALVRQNRIGKLFIDGQQQNLSPGPTNQYDRNSFNADYALSGTVSKMRLFATYQNVAYDMYTTEFALFNYAKYTANFTKPTKGPIVP